MFGCQVFGKQMLEQGSGSIINISSASSGPPLSKAFTYSVAKAGIKNLTQNLAREWATQGVRVNALSPGGVFVDQDDVFVERLTSLIPLGRMARRDDYRSAVQFLCSDAAAYLTGQNIVMDGGRSVW